MAPELVEAFIEGFTRRSTGRHAGASVAHGRSGRANRRRDAIWTG
jgi:hypothetical protein